MYLLDTNVVSELRQMAIGRGEPRVGAWAAQQPHEALFISAMTIFEIEVGIVRMERRDPNQGSPMRRWMNAFVLPTFATRILPVSDAVARTCATLHVPDPRPLSDSLIAATAMVAGLTVVTRNVADFQGLPISIFNPWLS